MNKPKNIKEILTIIVLSKSVSKLFIQIFNLP